MKKVVSLQNQDYSVKVTIEGNFKDSPLTKDEQKEVIACLTEDVMHDLTNAPYTNAKLFDVVVK